MTFCNNCGNKLKKEYIFCPKCGKSIELDKSTSLYETVKEYVISNQKVSIKLIQDEFEISSAKAIKLIKELEENCVVGPSNGSKGREILIKKEEDKEKFNKKNTSILKDSIIKVMSTNDETNNFEEDIEKNIFLAMLSYIGIFAFIPYFVHTDSKYVKFHATQGINLLIMEGIYILLDQALSLIKVRKVVVDYGSLVGTKMETPIWISLPMSIVGIVLLIISIIGVINVCNKKAKTLPIIGKINIIK